MKGLFLKDLYMMKKYYLIIAVIILLFTVWRMGIYAFWGIGIILADGDIVTMSVYTILITAVMFVGQLSADENERWQQYSMTLPVSRKQYISVKYLTTLSGVMTVSAGMSVIAVITMMTGKHTLYGSEMITALIESCSMGLLIPSIAFPLMIKFGQSGSWLVLIVIGMLFGTASGVFQWGYYFGIDELLGTDWYIWVSIFLEAVVLYILSWWLSVRIFQNKQF